MKNISNKNTENMIGMNIEAPTSNSYYSDRLNSCFFSLFKEGSHNNKANNSYIIDNLFSYNVSNMKWGTNMNNNYIFNKEKKDVFIPGLNGDKIMNSSGGNQSRFANYFKVNENGLNQNVKFFGNIMSNYNNNIFVNNKVNQNDNMHKYDSNCINNLNMNLKYDNNSNYMNQNKNQYKDYQNMDKINNIDLSNMNYTKANSTNYNNNINSNHNELNIIIPKSILSRNSDYQEFLNYVNGLNVPLIKFLCTKKGISEMENYLNSHKRNDIEILIFLLNKEGITKLMKHKFGNYFIQEIIKDVKYPQIKLLLDLISSTFVEIAESNCGTHVLQALLDTVNTFELRDIVLKSIENKELEMAFNNNATYVLQKIIGIVPDTERLNLNEIILNNLINLALNSDCIFIVEKFISTISIKENKEKINDIICENCIKLATDPYGNYLIQYLFQIWKDSDIEKINNIIIENANFLAKQRYSSNVIEKAIELYDINIKPKLIRSLSLGGDILEIIKNQYGHYVLNKAVKYMDETLKNEIETLLNNKMPDMTKKEKTKSKKFIANLRKNGKNNKKNYYSKK
jgi:hypothetical protein